MSEPALSPVHETVAAARRDLAALRTSAVPTLIALIGRKVANPMAIEHARHRVQSMLIAAAQRVALAVKLSGCAALADELDAVVAAAIEASAFAGYELLVAYVRAPEPQLRA